MMPQKMPDPRRPWRFLEWRRIIDDYHACQYVQQFAEVIFGSGPESQHWAKRMREQLENQGQWGRSGLAVGGGVAASARPVGASQGLGARLCVSEKAQLWDALSVLQTRALAHRLWYHRGRLQDGLHAAAQAFGDVMDERGWSRHPGPAGALVEWRLGGCSSEIRNVETPTRHPCA